MKTFSLLSSVFALGLLAAVPAMAQPDTAGKQKTDGNSPTVVGPASGAYQQGTQSPAHGSAMKQATDGESPTTVGPASGAYRQRTDGESPTMVGPASRAFKQN